MNNQKQSYLKIRHLNVTPEHYLENFFNSKNWILKNGEPRPKARTFEEKMCEVFSREKEKRCFLNKVYVKLNFCEGKKVSKTRIIFV